MNDDMRFELAELKVSLQNIELYLGKRVASQEQIENIQFFLTKAIDRIGKIERMKQGVAL